MRERPRGKRIALAATLVVAAGVALLAQDPASQEPLATFRSSVEAVQLSVIVTDADGRPVSGLTESDFEILENGVARPVTTFSAVDIPIERTERSVVERDVLSNDGPQGRLYVIALDQMSSVSALRAHAILRRFIENYFGPNDTAAVVLTTGGPRDSGQEFTSNPRRLMDAIDKFDGGTVDMSERLREKNFIGDFRNLMQFMATLRGGRKAVIFVSEGIPVDAYQVVDHRGGFGLFALRTRAFLRQFIDEHLAPNDTVAVMLTTGGLRDSGQDFTSDRRLLLSAIDKFDGGVPDLNARLRERNFIGDFLALMRFMSKLQVGRKAVIFISENIPPSADAYLVVDRGRARFGGLFSEVDTEWVDALSLATRNNIAVYPVDPRGLTTEAGASLEERMDLNALAEVTGGFALVGSNSYAAAFERLVRENSSYYLIGFNSAVEYRDGRYVPLDVRVKRPGLRVQSTAGYVSPRGKQPPPQRQPDTVLSATWDAVKSAIVTSGVPMRMSAAAFKGHNKDATVAITLEIAADKLNLVEEKGAHRGTLEVLFAVTDAKKKRWPIWRHRWGLALKPDTYERVNRGAMRVISQLKLPAGRYQVRASAGGAATAGSVVYDLEVPDFTRDLSLSGVALTSSETQRTFTFSPHAELDVALPGPPTTAREFSRGDTLTVFLEAYEARRKPHTVTFTVDLLDDGGKSLSTYVLEQKPEANARQSGAYTFARNLPLNGIPPGQYVLRVGARSSLDKDKQVSREVVFGVR